MKKIIFILSIFITSLAVQANPSPTPSSNQNQQGCPVSGAETLVCSVILCNPIGLAINKSRSKCLDVNRRFAWYLATLGFWSKPPKCQMRDKSCNKVGKATDAQIDPSYCDSLGTEAEQNACKAALGGATQEYCDTFEGVEKLACEAKKKQTK